jgi:hypothetical protein
MDVVIINSSGRPQFEAAMSFYSSRSSLRDLTIVLWLLFFVRNMTRLAMRGMICKLEGSLWAGIFKGLAVFVAMEDVVVLARALLRNHTLVLRR